MFIGIVVALIDFGGADAVEDHFGDVAAGHFSARERTVLRRIHAVVNPVLEMVFVPSLVMQPGRRDTGCLPLRVIRAARALEIFGPDQKLRRRELRQVVRNALIVKACAEAVFPYELFVLHDGEKV